MYPYSAVLSDYGYVEEIEELLGGTRWHYLLLMRAESSLPLTIEFVCYLELERSMGSRRLNLDSIDSHTQLTFTLLGQYYCLSVEDLGIRLGLYTEQEMRSREIHDAPYQLPADVDVATFQAEHSIDPDPFEAPARARHWIRLTWRIFSFVLSTPFFGRLLNTDRVYVVDMLVFWSLHTRREANVAIFLARFLYSQSMGTRTHLVCGFVVTLLFRSFMRDAPIPQPQMLMRDLDVSMLRNAHIRRRIDASSSERNMASSSASESSHASS